MPELIVVAFPNEAPAFAAGKTLVALQQQYRTTLQDVVVVTRATDDRVQVKQTLNAKTGKPIGGGLWGTLIAMLFLKNEAGAGALHGPFGRMGLDDSFLQDISQSLAPGGSAVGMLNRDLPTDKVLEKLALLGGSGKVMCSALDAGVETRLRNFMDRLPPLNGAKSAVGH